MEYDKVQSVYFDPSFHRLQVYCLVGNIFMNKEVLKSFFLYLAGEVHLKTPQINDNIQRKHCRVSVFYLFN